MSQQGVVRIASIARWPDKMLASSSNLVFRGVKRREIIELLSNSDGIDGVPCRACRWSGMAGKTL